VNITKKKYSEAIEILGKYKGKNSHILYVKSLYEKNGSVKDLDVEYILYNHERNEPLLVDKNIKIALEYGHILNKRYQLDFVPTQIYVRTLAGETDFIYHVWCKFAPNQDKWVSLFLPKKYTLDTLMDIDWDKCDIDIPKLNSMLEASERSVLDHQVPAFKFLLAARKCILADQMGLSKTSSAIGASISGNFKHILIISPASVKSTWKKELSFYGINDVEIIQGTNPDKWNLKAKYCICNYDIFNQHLHEVAYDTVIDEWTGKPKQVKSRNKEKVERIMAKNPLIQNSFDLIIIDEAHKLSNSTSKRYKSILDFIQKNRFEYIWVLSGTPITNNHKNYYNILKLIQCDITNDWAYYMERYCGAKTMRLKTGKEILVPKADTNGDELRERTKHFYLRRLKSDIPGLPKRTIIEKYFELSDNERKKYEKLWSEYEQAQIEQGGDNSSTSQQLVEGTLYRQFLAEKMVPNTIELTEDWLESGSKVIIGCCYHKEIEMFQKHFKDSCVVFHGAMTAIQKDKAQDKFINDPSVKVFVGNIIAAGTGITLISSNVLIMNSFDYVPGNNSQMLDRNYRIGQTNEVYSYFMLFNQTHNEWMWTKVVKKMMVIDTVIKDEKSKDLKL
jgi:SWI/SNF-related matrix-associated actin-dependent regulator 1 of chromatin subfamily A